MTAITTYATFVDTLRDLSVTGVIRRFEYPPMVVDTADLPASWPMLPEGIEAMMTAKTAGGWPTLICSLIIATEPVGQNTQAQKYADILTMMDNLSTALRGAFGSIGRGPVTWSIRGSASGGVEILVGSVAYWGVIATVTAY